MKRVFDCFAFFNELDLLELRLRELWDIVDAFILVEATRTFQKNSKPLFYQENQKRFESYKEKIIPIVVDHYPSFWTHLRPVKTWDYDSHQKEHILEGLKKVGVNPEDLVIVSDVDEIPLKEKVLEYKNKRGIRVFEQYQSYYFLNYVCTRINDYGGKAVAQRNREGWGRWRGSVMLEFEFISSLKTIEKTRRLRDFERSDIQVIPEGGWHFSNMGGIEKIIYKFQSWAHKEYNNPHFISREIVIKNVLEGRDLLKEGMKYELVDIMSSSLPFPNELKENLNRYQSLIRTREQLEKGDWS